MEKIAIYLKCGQYCTRSKSSVGDYIVRRSTDITENIISFFKKYNIEGTKAKDFSDFCKVAEIMKTKGHLTESGLEEIRLIKDKMNRGRID